MIVSSSAKPAGAMEFKVHQPNTVENAKWYNNYEDITLNMGGRVATGNDDVWFITVPTDLSGTDLTVKVSTDKNDYIKTIDLTGKTLTFERADIARFTVKDLLIMFVELMKPDVVRSQVLLSQVPLFCRKIIKYLI